MGANTSSKPATTTPLKQAVRWATEAERSKFPEHAALAQAWAMIALADQMQGANYLANGGVNLGEMEIRL